MREEGYISYRIDDFQGSGADSGYYDEAAEAKDRKENAWHLMILMAGILLCLGLTTYLAGTELVYYLNGTKQTITYNPANRLASFQAPDGNTYNVETTWAMTNKQTIDVYYMGTDYEHAMVMTTIVLWIVSYGVFGGLLVVVAYFIHKNLKPKRHTIAKE